MLRKVMVVIMLLLSLVGACAPQAGSPTPTAAGTGAGPKVGSGAVSVTTPGPTVEKPQRGGTLIFAMNQEANQLDPQKQADGGTRRWGRLMFNTLTNTDESGNIIPELAESWSYPDPNTPVMKLRKGVKFHDGTDFNAQAVKFNIDRVQDPATKAVFRARLDNIRSVEVVDDYTVKFNLKTPQASILSVLSEILTAAMVSPASVKKWGDETISHPVGTGPFEFVEWVKGDHLTVKRFKDYWRKDQFGDPLPYLDEVVIKPVPDSTVRLTNLRTGAVDLDDVVEAPQLSAVKADKNLKTVEWGSSSFNIKLNNSQPSFNNKALRQAVAWAVDLEAIHKAIYGGRGVPAQYWLDPKSWAFDPTGKFYSRDVAKAKEKLAEGGKPNGFKFEAKVYNTDLEQRVAQAIKGQLAEVGIEMDIVPLQEGQLRSEQVSGKFEAILHRDTGLPADPDDELYAKFYSKGAQNVTQNKYNNPQVDALLEQARQVYDRTERKALYAKAQALILDDSPQFAIHHDQTTSAMNQKVMGFTPNINIYYFQLDWMWLKK